MLLTIHVVLMTGEIHCVCYMLSVLSKIYSFVTVPHEICVAGDGCGLVSDKSEISLVRKEQDRGGAI